MTKRIDIKWVVGVLIILYILSGWLEKFSSLSSEEFYAPFVTNTSDYTGTVHESLKFSSSIDTFSNQQLLKLRSCLMSEARELRSLGSNASDQHFYIKLESKENFYVLGIKWRKSERKAYIIGKETLENMTTRKILKTTGLGIIGGSCFDELFTTFYNY